MYPCFCDTRIITVFFEYLPSITSFSFRGSSVIYCSFEFVFNILYNANMFQYRFTCTVCHLRAVRYINISTMLHELITAAVHHIPCILLSFPCHSILMSHSFKTNVHHIFLCQQRLEFQLENFPFTAPCCCIISSLSQKCSSFLSG